MPVFLPPIHPVRYGDATTKLVYDGLTSFIAGHPQAIHPYTFYEKVDQWLGPWGQTGYPLAYGKFYNIAFTTNKKLNAHRATRDWVWKTTILLQEAMRDYIVERFKDQNLPITEPQLRRAAFQSHPRAYTQAGLARVVLTDPALLIVIAEIPEREFVPGTPNFGPSVTQALKTLDLVWPQVLEEAPKKLLRFAEFHMSSHNEQQTILKERLLKSNLNLLMWSIRHGEVDDIPTLRSIVEKLGAQKFSDSDADMRAKDVIAAARYREAILHAYYRDLMKHSPEVSKRIYDRYRNLFFPAPR